MTLEVSSLSQVPDSSLCFSRASSPSIQVVTCALSGFLTNLVIKNLKKKIIATPLVIISTISTLVII